MYYGLWRLASYPQKIPLNHRRIRCDLQLYGVGIWRQYGITANSQ